MTWCRSLHQRSQSEHRVDQRRHCLVKSRIVTCCSMIATASMMVRVEVSIDERPFGGQIGSYERSCDARRYQMIYNEFRNIPEPIEIV